MTNTTANCCRRPDIARMVYEHFDRDTHTSSPRIYRVCLTCLTHWFGTPDSVTQYTGKEWDKMLAEAIRI
jgi:hypothetical protein